MQNISGPAASRPQVIALAVVIIGCDFDGGPRAQNNLPQAYALGTSLSIPSADLCSSN